MPESRKQTAWVLGLMSGTSLDGVDAALLETDGEAVARPGLALNRPYAPTLRAALRAALDAAPAVASGAPPPAAIVATEADLTQAHAAAVADLLSQAEMTPSDVALIGFHGQTILHRPEARRTWQLGNGAVLAKTTGIPVINDFRSADVAAGGQGAPFVPLYHAALVHAAGLPLPVVVVNIGGVANVTYVGDNALLAFDTGPGNAALDDWAQRHTGMPIDREGALAGAGRVDERTLAAMLADPYFAKLPPKSLDRLDFGEAAVAHLSAANGAATLTAFTAASIAGAAAHFPRPVTRWIVCGGGRCNPVLMAALSACVKAPVSRAEDVGWHGDYLEAEAFAYLAMRSVKGLPLSLPSTTGVPSPTTGGRLHRPG